MTRAGHPVPPSAPELTEVARAFLWRGCVSFGGPTAHLGYFRAEFVTRRGWLSEQEFGDLVALCQFLPGPASSQLAFALGHKRAGISGGIAATVCFLVPSVLIVLALAYGVADHDELSRAGWLVGLKLAAVAVVADAVRGMLRALCPDAPRRWIALLTAALLLAVPGVVPQVVATAGGAVTGWLRDRHTAVGGAAVDAQPGHVWRAVAPLSLCAALLVLLPWAASATGLWAVELFDRFFRAGALVFGGGHVILPLLRAELVPTGWLSNDRFVAGYAAAQALPGPLFSFAAYLGVVMFPGPHAWLAGLWCLLAIFLPGLLLVAGALPLWHRLRVSPGARALIAGANASVVGILLAALCGPLASEAIANPVHLLTALLAWAALTSGRVPSWAVVLGCAAAGEVAARL